MEEEDVVAVAEGKLINSAACSSGSVFQPGIFKKPVGADA